MSASVRKAPGYLKRAVMYQIFLRPFTPGGTLNSAAEMLPHLASLGVDILYLCPVTEADGDMRPEFWSARQKACGLGNPKNPYRVGDYYRIDPEYGTDADLKRFTAYAHELGMSYGKYYALLELETLGAEVTAEDVQNMTMGEIWDMKEQCKNHNAQSTSQDQCQTESEHQSHSGHSGENGHNGHGG